MMMSLGLPPDLTWYKLLMDQGSFIGGGFALIAGAAAYIGARQAAARQIAAMAHRLQARGIVVGIYPELLIIQVRHERAVGIINEVFPQMTSDGPSDTIGNIIRGVKIEIPPFLSRNTDNLFLVAPGGPSLVQVVSFTLQYNSLTETLGNRISMNIEPFDPVSHRDALSGHLRAIALALADAIREIGPI
jgi:hypothetical protein